MIDLLSHPLIRKYFLPENYCFPSDKQEQSAIALAIIISMQEPIKKGLKVLVNDQMGDHCIWREDTVGAEATALFQATQEYHPGMLVLPDRFQKQEKTAGDHCNIVGHWCHNCGEDLPQPAPELEKCDFSTGQDCLAHKPKDKAEFCNCGCHPREGCCGCNPEPALAPEQAKVACGCPSWEYHYSHLDCAPGPETCTPPCSKHSKPKDEVDEKIVDLTQRYVGAFSLHRLKPTDDIEKELRELVELVRNEHATRKV